MITVVDQEAPSRCLSVSDSTHAGYYEGQVSPFDINIVWNAWLGAGAGFELSGVVLDDVWFAVFYMMIEI